MKRAALTRKTPLRRKTRIKSRGDNGYRNRTRDWAFMAWVRRQPCSARNILVSYPSMRTHHLVTGVPVGEEILVPSTPCSGRVEADHAGKKPAGWRKAPDRTCIPMCKKHHRERETFSGMFRHWDKESMRRWLDARIAVTQGEYDRGSGRTVRHPTVNRR